MKYKNIFFIMFIFIVGIAIGQDFPRIKKAAIKCEVYFTQSQGLFYYKYRIKNDVSSTGDLFSFEIDVSMAKEKIIDTVGLKFQNNLLRNFFRRGFNLSKGKVIPIGVSQVPDGGVGLTSVSSLAVGFAGFPDEVVKPGNSLDNVEINCVGLPSIRKVTFSIAKGSVIEQLPGLEDTTSTMTESQRDSILASLDYTTWTVGPNVYTDNISFVGVLDSIKSYTERSAILNWIVDKKEDNKEKDDKEKKKDSEIVKELMKSIDKAREQLSKNKTKEAKKQLEEFVKKVEEYYEKSSEEEKGKKERGSFTSEAYALLKYNAEYLIGQLK